MEKSFSNILGVKEYIYKIERITKYILFFYCGRERIIGK